MPCQLRSASGEKAVEYDKSGAHLICFSSFKVCVPASFCLLLGLYSRPSESGFKIFCLGLLNVIAGVSLPSSTPETRTFAGASFHRYFWSSAIQRVHLPTPVLISGWGSEAHPHFSSLSLWSDRWMMPE